MGARVRILSEIQRDFLISESVVLQFEDSFRAYCSPQQPKTYPADCMLTENHDFLAAICEKPEDDAPRLIYADWLDEHGQESRAEFIRVQCALASIPDNDPRRPALEECEADHLTRHHSQWSECLKGFAGWTEFRRGFIETINIESRRFLQHADELFSIAPIRNVRLLDVGSSLSRIVDCPMLSRLNALTIYAQHRGEDLPKALASSPYLENLTGLNLGRNRLGDRGAELIATSTRFKNLSQLDLRDNAIGDQGASAFGESSQLKCLNSLELGRNEIGRRGLEDLVCSPTLEGLRHIGLTLNYVGAQRSGAPKTGSSGVTSLDLSGNAIGPDSIMGLIELSGLIQLQNLDLAHNELGNTGAWALSRWNLLSGIRVLKLNSNRIGDEGVRSLARSNYLSNLTELDLSENPIHDAGALELLSAPSLTRLTRLGMPNLGLTPTTRRALQTRFREKNPISG